MSEALVIGNTVVLQDVKEGISEKVNATGLELFCVFYIFSQMILWRTKTYYVYLDCT